MLRHRKAVAKAGVALIVSLSLGDPVVVRSQSCSPPADGAAAGVQHVVFIVMENRSYDHLLGWLDGPDAQYQPFKARFKMTEPASCTSS
jgi:phospholipase C